MAPDRHPGCPGAPPANVRGAFNAHSPGDGGSGLVQPVFRSPARIPAAESIRKGLCAAPPSEKRYTLSYIEPTTAARATLQRLYFGRRTPLPASNISRPARHDGTRFAPETDLLGH